MKRLRAILRPDLPIRSSEATGSGQAPQNANTDDSDPFPSYQGKRRDQVETSEHIVAIGLFVLFVLILVDLVAAI